MELEDLNPSERLALVALIRAIVLADRAASDEEAERVEDVVLALGEEAYQKTLDEASARFPDEEALRAFLAGLATSDRQEARELIYGTVLDLAMVDGVGINEESELLAWLGGAWRIEPELQEPVPA
jgi:hypothetical protein